MKFKGIFKVIGKSTLKVAKIGAIGAGSVILSNPTQTVEILSSINPWVALTFSVLYAGIDAYKHRDKV